MKDNLIFKGYIGYSILYLLIVFLIDGFSWLFKPLLLLFLIFAVYKTEYFRMRKTLLSALIFSWFGDIVLLLVKSDELFFILGLLLFLVSHLFYIKLFLKQRTDRNGFRKPLFWFGWVVVLCYLQSILSLLFPKLGDLKIPVALYAVVISAMLIMALRMFFGIRNVNKYFFVIGAVSFVVSDSILAIDKFYEPLQYASLLIMATYILAQGFLTYGTLNLNIKK